MSRLVSIDPGKHACSIACWHDYTLVHAAWIENLFRRDQGKERADSWGDLGKRVADVIGTELGSSAPISLIVEVPQIYPGPRREDPNDLIDLAGVLGAIIGVTRASVVWSPFPRQWKGQAPKEVTQQRVEAKLSDLEKGMIEWPASRLRHNVYDAIHLGIVYLERQGLRNFRE
jgi:hypothetical protein